MTREELFKINFPEYVTEKGECLSPYWNLFSAGIECATYELNKGCIQTLTKEKAELEKENAELKEISVMQSDFAKQLDKAKEIMQKLIANAPNTYSGTNIELQQKKMFSFQDAVNKAEQFLNSKVKKMTEDDFLERIDNGFN